MASTVTTYGNSVRVIKVAWTSDGSGDATGAVFIDGELKRMTTDPGSTAPTSNYDVTLVDDAAYDILGGAGANRHASTTETVVPAVSGLHYGAATLTVSNAGDSKDGAAYLYYR